MSSPRRRTTGSFSTLGGGRNKNPRRTGKTTIMRPTLRGPVVSLFVAVLALSGCVVALHYGWQALRGSSRLRVARIEVTGTERAGKQEIIAHAALLTGMSILDVDLDAAAVAARRHPWVKSAMVRRRLPDTISIEVKEFQPAALVALGELYLAEVDGTPFKRLGVEDRPISPIVTGIEGDAQSDVTEVARKVADGLAIQRALAQSAVSFGRLEELHWDPDLGWELVVWPEGYRQPVRVHLGKSPLERVEVAERALERLRGDGRRAASIYANLEPPQRVHVRLRSSSVSENDNNSTLIATARSTR